MFVLSNCGVLILLGFQPGFRRRKAESRGKKARGRVGTRVYALFDWILVKKNGENVLLNKAEGRVLRTEIKTLR